MTDKQWSGYFFDYNKLFWAYTGERTTIGNPHVSENDQWRARSKGSLRKLSISRTRKMHAGTSRRTTVLSSKPNLPMPAARAGFAMGNRYELGYRDQGHGWLISVLDGGTVESNDDVRFRPATPRATVASPPFIPRDYTNGTDVSVHWHRGTTVRWAMLVPSASAACRSCFKRRLATCKGFRDYLQNLVRADGGTVGWSACCMWAATVYPDFQKTRPPIRQRFHLPPGRRPQRQRHLG